MTQKHTFKVGDRVEYFDSKTPSNVVCRQYIGKTGIVHWISDYYVSVNFDHPCGDYVTFSYHENLRLYPPKIDPPKIDWSKPVQTRNGRAVRILCTDGPDKKFPVLGIISGDITVTAWPQDGSYSVPALALMNAPPPKETRTVKLYLWRSKNGGVKLCTEDHYQYAKEHVQVLGTTTVTVTEGDGM